MLVEDYLSADPEGEQGVRTPLENLKLYEGLDGV